jgi:hypothetical protein
MQRTIPKAPARPRLNRQAGISVTELLVLTAPLCVLSMILSSKLAATSSAHISAEWQTSLQTQLAAKVPCGANPQFMAPWIKPATGVEGAVESTMNIASQAGSIFDALGSTLMAGYLALQYMDAIPMDLLTSPELVDTNWATVPVTVRIAPYYFQPQAELLIQGPVEVSSSSTFICNEPYDGDAIRAKKREQLIGKMTFEATGIYE